MQPLNVGFLHTLKSAWLHEAVNFRIIHEGKQMQKHDFPSSLTLATIVNGFNACELVKWRRKM